MTQHITHQAQRGCQDCKPCEGGGANIGRNLGLATLFLFTGGIGLIAVPFSKKCVFCGHRNLFNRHRAR